LCLRQKQSSSRNQLETDFSDHLPCIDIHCHPFLAFKPLLSFCSSLQAKKNGNPCCPKLLGRKGALELL